ncbi:MAG: ATP-binding protein [Rhodospirillaceae bacterium]
MAFETVIGDEGLTPIIRYRGLGLRLIGYILLFSTGVTLTFTLLQLYWDHRRDVGAIERRLDEVQSSTAGSLGASLWQMDLDQVRLLIEGILRLPDIQAVTVRPTTGGAPGAAWDGAARDGPVVEVGRPRAGAALTRDYPVIYRFQGQDQTLARVAIEATLDEVYRRLWDTALVILVSQGVKTFLVSLFTLFIVWKLVTRHLAAIARFVGRFDIRRAPLPRLDLARPRHPSGGGDELDQVVGAFNGLAGSLHSVYRELQTVNAELAADNHARRLAEQEVQQLNAQLEQRVRQRTFELEAANRDLGAFAYSVSHDLRAPLRRIEGFGRILAEDYGERLECDGLDTISRIRSGVREMGEMIDSFLRLSLSTRQELTLEPVDLSLMAAAVVTRLREKEPGRKVAVTIEPGLGATADRRLIRLVLENLLDNAWKYTRDAPAPMVLIGRSAGADGGGGEFFVRDNGAGFDMAFAGRLFSPFQRLHAPEDYEGSGIGLATVHRIIARHGGAIRAEAEVGAGATFFFTLPAGDA